MATVIKPRLIPFRDEMVRAILAGRKTQTRRIVNGSWTYDGETGVGAGWEPPPCPYGSVGDFMQVREALVGVFDTKIDAAEEMPIAAYASDRAHAWTRDKFRVPWRWKPIRLAAMYMPREMSRITLEITNVRVEHLNDISEADAYAEGVTIPDHLAFSSNGNPELRNEARATFRDLWESINGKGSWAANPWVFAITFRVLEGPAR